MDIKVNTAGITGASSMGTLSGVKKTDKAEQTEKAAETTVIKAPNVDKVELSEEAVQYLNEENSSETESVETSEEIVSDSTAETVSESDETVLASELYSYTETELRELLLNGTITRAEYEAELASRAAE